MGFSKTMENKNSVTSARPYEALGKWIREHRGSHSQAWLANLLGVSDNFISMVEKGKRSLDDDHLCILAVQFRADIFKLAKLAKLEDITALQKKYNSFYFFQTESPELISQLQNVIQIARLSRENGDPDLTIRFLPFWINLVESRIQNEADNLKTIWDLKHILIRVYAERIACNNEYLSKSECVTAALPDFARIQKLSIDINDSHGLGIGFSWLAGAYFVDGFFEKAREHAQKSIPFLENNSFLFAETLRGLIIDNAFLSDLRRHEETERRAIRAVESGQIKSSADVTAIYEGIGLAKTQLGDQKAIEYIKKAENEMNRVDENKTSRPLRYLQIHRTRLFYYLTMKKLGIPFDYQEIAYYAGQAINSTKAINKYPRHRGRILGLIEQLQLPTCYGLLPSANCQ